MTQNPAGRRRPSVSILIACTLIFILAVATVVGAVTVFQLPDPITETSKDVNILYEAVLAVSFVIFFLVTAGIIWAIFRYRRVDDTIPEQIHGSSTAEALWTVIPIIILVVLFVPSMIYLLDIKNQPADEDIEVRVEAVGHQWWWEFKYPDDGVTVQATPPNYEDLAPPTLVVPVGKTISIAIRSTDVIHSFGIPHTLYKMHAVPGNINYMHVKIEDVGVYVGQCYQFCGLRHSDMRFILDARSEADYEAWLRETQAAQGVVPESDTASREDD
ncbi:MAG TPA: cytochrome c oxidase subunit II [Dehalococcoidia bacterium]|jgi:cytochrome c oxidase subunit 2|nr:cytochrome c oxidase subunit II [Dehalococcoidia bacterium]